MIIDLTKEEIEDVLSNLEQCDSEGYISVEAPTRSAMDKLYEALDLMIKG